MLKVNKQTNISFFGTLIKFIMYHTQKRVFGKRKRNKNPVQKICLFVKKRFRISEYIGDLVDYLFGKNGKISIFHFLKNIL